MRCILIVFILHLFGISISIAHVHISAYGGIEKSYDKVEFRSSIMSNENRGLSPIIGLKISHHPEENLFGITSVLYFYRLLLLSDEPRKYIGGPHTYNPKLGINRS